MQPDPTCMLGGGGGGGGELVAMEFPPPSNHAVVSVNTPLGSFS